jgi:hypothetical protein
VVSASLVNNSRHVAAFTGTLQHCEQAEAGPAGLPISLFILFRVSGNAYSREDAACIFLGFLKALARRLCLPMG